MSNLPPIGKSKGACGLVRARARKKKAEGRAHHNAAWQGSPSSFFELTWSSTSNRHIRNHQNPPTLLAYDAHTTVVGVPDASGASQLNDGAARDSRAARAAVLRGEDLLRRVQKLGAKGEEAAPAAQLIQMLQEACEHFGAADDRMRMIEAVHVRGRVLGDRALRRSSERVREHDFDGCVDALREAAQHFSVLSSGVGLNDNGAGSSSTQPRRSDEAVAAAAGGPELEHRQRRKAADDSARLERCVNPAVATVKLAMKDAHALIAKHSSELRRKAFVSALDSACMAEKSASWAVSRCERMCRVDASGTVEASTAILELLASAKSVLSSCSEAQQTVAIEQQLAVGRELLAMVASARLGASDAQIARLTAARCETGNRPEEDEVKLAEAGTSNNSGDASARSTNASEQQAAVPPMVVRRQMLSTVLSQSVAAFGDLLLQDLRRTKLQQLWSMAEVLREYSCLASDNEDMNDNLKGTDLADIIGTDPVAEDGYEDERKDFIAQARAAAAQAVAQVQEEEDGKDGENSSECNRREETMDRNDNENVCEEVQQEVNSAEGESSQLLAKADVARVLRDTARAAKLQWTLYELSKDAAADPLGLSRRLVVRRAFANAQKQIGFALDSVLTSVMVPVSPSYSQQLNAVHSRLDQQLKAARLALDEAKTTSDAEHNRLQAAHKELLDSDRARREAIAVVGERGWRKALMDRDAVIHATQHGCGIKLLEEQPDLRVAVEACVQLIDSLEKRLEKSVVEWHSTEETTSAALSQLENDVTAGAEKMHRVETKVRREKHKLELKNRIKHVETRRHAMQRELDKARDITAGCTSMVMTGPYGLADDDEVTAQRTICAKRIETVAFNLSTEIDVDTSDAETEKALDILALGVAKALEEAKHTHALLETKSQELELAKLKRDEQEVVERERIREEELEPARAELHKLRAECEDAGVVGAALLELDVVKKAIFCAEEALSQAALACGRPVETKYAATMGAMLQIVRENCVLAGNEARASLKIVRTEVARLRAELDERRLREQELRGSIDKEILAPARAALDAGEAEIASHAHGLRDDAEVAEIMVAAAQAHASVIEQRMKPLDVESEDTLQSSLLVLREAAEVVAEQVRETMKKVNDVRASLDKAHKQRQNKDKQTRDKLRNRTLGMARQQLRMTESLLKIDEQLKEDAPLMTAIANAHAEIEKADLFLQQPSDLSSDATLEADTESATAKANTVLAIAQDVMDQANETAARLKKAREG